MIKVAIVNSLQSVFWLIINAEIMQFGKNQQKLNLKIASSVDIAEFSALRVRCQKFWLDKTTLPVCTPVS